LKDTVANVYISPPVKVLLNFNKAVYPSNPFSVTFVGFEGTDYPAGAKEAFKFATDLISSYIDLRWSDSIRIIVVWKEGDSTKSPLASTFDRYDTVTNGANKYFCPLPLAEKLNGMNLNGTIYDDSIVVYKIKGKERFYFGADGLCPGTQYDFATIVLHEIVHSLGFSSSFYLQNGKAYYGLDSLGHFTFNGRNGTPMLYDSFVVDSLGGWVKPLMQADSPDMANYITRGYTFFQSDNSKIFNNNSLVCIGSTEKGIMS